MESTTKCFCKGIRTCKICSDYKSSIIEKKKSSQEKFLLNKHLTVTTENIRLNEKSLSKSNIEKQTIQIINHSIELSNIDNPQEVNNFSINVNKEKNEKTIEANLPKTEKFLLENLFENIKNEIIEESNSYKHYKPLINFIPNENAKSKFESENIKNAKKKPVFNGFYVIKNLFDEAEQENLIREINKYSWSESQSGRKKQDYGPKINYKKKKLRIDEINLEININRNKSETNNKQHNNNFFINTEEKTNKNANNTNIKTEILNNSSNNNEYKKLKFKEFQFPYFSEAKCSFYKLIQEKLNNLNFLADFKIAEIGNLYYEHSRGAHIEPHIDDSWIWGKRIIGINLLSDTKITFSLEIELTETDKNKNNNKINDCDNNNNNNIDYDNYNEKKEVLFEIEIPVAKGDVYVMADFSRYDWKHSVKLKHIAQDRIVITLREFEENFLSEYFLDYI